MKLNKEWHTEHLKNWQCRTDIPEKIKVAMELTYVNIMIGIIL